MLGTRKKIFNIITMVLAVSLIMTVGINRAQASDEKDVILVLDTSLSMIGYGGAYKSRNILGKVKKSIGTYIDDLDDGDRVTFMTFDSDVRIYPTIYVDDDNDRDILKKYISMTDAKGKWTNTFQMIKTAFKTADDLEKEDDDRQIVIVVMTDGLDDPPPYSRNRRLDIKEISKRYSNKSWWVYLVNLNELKDNKRIAKLRKDLTKVTKHTKVIEAGDDVSKGIEQDIKKDIQSKESNVGSIILSLLIVFLIIAIIIAIIYYFYQYSLLKITGKLEYWNNEVLDPYISTTDLGRRGERTVQIGRGFSYTINIRDINIESPFNITAVRVEKEIKFKIESGGKYKIEFVNKQQGPYLENGDIFKVANYTFKFAA